MVVVWSVPDRSIECMMEDVIDFDINTHTVTPAPIDGEIADTLTVTHTKYHKAIELQFGSNRIVVRVMVIVACFLSIILIPK